MGTTYAEKLKHPKWQKKRLQILQRDNFSCQLCGDTETTLHIHHEVYRKGEVWEYENHELITYCEHCHAVIEYNKKQEEIIAAKIIKRYTGKDGIRLYLIYLDIAENETMIDAYFYKGGSLNYLLTMSKNTLRELNDIVNV